MRDVKYVASKYEVHDCELGNELIPCIVVSDSFRYSDTMDIFMVIPLKNTSDYGFKTMEEAETFVAVTGYNFVPVMLDNKVYLADVTGLTSVEVSNMLGYRFTITGINIIKKLNDVIINILTGEPTLAGNTKTTCIIANKYDVWELDNGRDVMILNNINLQNGFIVCYVDDDYDSFGVVYNHLNHKMYAHTYSPFNVESHILKRRKYTVVSPEIIGHIDGAIMNIFFNSSFLESFIETFKEVVDKNNVEDIQENTSVEEDSVLRNDSVDKIDTEEETDSTDIEKTIIDFSNIGSDGDDNSDIESSIEDLVPEKCTKKYSTHSRKRIPMPENFNFYYNNMKKGIIKKSEIEKTFHVSPPVVNRWIKEYERYFVVKPIDIDLDEY